MRPPSIERLAEDLGDILRRRSMRNDRQRFLLSRGSPIRFAVIALVSDDGARGDIRTDGHQGFEFRGIGFLAARQIEGDREAIEIGLEVYFRRKAAARAAQRLVFLPPFAPAADT